MPIDETILPIDEAEDIAVGVTLPLTFGDQGDFNLSYDTIEQAKSNLKNLLLTMKGERPMQPEFGSDVHKLLFEPIDDTLEDSIKSIIVTDIQNWLPYILIDKIVVKTNDADVDRSRVEVSIDFHLSDDPTTYENLTFDIQGE